ncbi:carboxylesterase family protein [Roseibacterium sp. SDUM158017]|uniref:carboxylesterase/lipase family protein n=1 Tax=Roseicyclus salinarum TaxID=3036773 RepID=UPI002415422D|nr:carboxylesterase family protein [Roseibacterium sp. SDUM158017]MDG4648189.1 carboxylesterase family protein [Roseibacterium sp. SDUM158017]
METVTVEIASGRVRGESSGGMIVFRGIPYAAPPVGEARLRPPRPVRRWEGTRDALAFGPKPPQTDYPDFVRMLLPEFVGPGDDCLTLNVFTSGLEPARRPVMVWVPGGLFEFHGTGASPLYDGSAFAEDGIVCVTINYRVGAEGFLHLGDGQSNIGLLDQIAALAWVRDNIAAFGGDPGCVTVFGESAGALAIGTLLAMPRAKGLFRRAIIQSGGGHHVSAPETALRIGRRLAGKMGVAPTREAIAAAPREALLAAQAELRQDLEAAPDPAVWGEAALTMLPWQPVLDGDTLPRRPVDAVRDGSASEIDLMVGTNLDETRLFLAEGDALGRITDEAAAGMAAAYGLPPQEALAAYRRLLPGASPGDLFSALQTDWYWRLPALRLSEAHAGGGPGRTYFYEFGWRGSPAFGGRLGAAHSMEIPFVFKSFGPATEAVLGPEPPQGLADAMHRAWTAFAWSGDPGWPEFDPLARSTMHFDETPRVLDDPMGGIRRIWHGIR